MYAEPSWMRLGFTQPPDERSGKGIGIIIIDDISPHPALTHIGQRLRHVVVADDLSVTCRVLGRESFDPDGLEDGIHGLMTMLTLTHQPFYDHGFRHIGIAPSANYVVLSHGAFKEGEGDRLKRGVEWILDNLPEFNVRLVLSLGWHAQDNPVLIQRTQYNSTVRALQPAMDRGILVVCSNGNSNIDTIMPPVDFLAVGGYNDGGMSDRTKHVAYPGELYGFNGDGDFRPDIRAPRTRVAIPYCEGEPNAAKRSYYTGTSASSTLVAGVCLHILARFPWLSARELRNALAHFGEPLPGDPNVAPCIHVRRTVEAVTKGDIHGQTRSMIDRGGIVERAIRLSRCIREQQCTRNDLWKYSCDVEPLIRKIATYSLRRPVDPTERDEYWRRFHEESDDGVRTWYLYGLLQDSSKEELARWVLLADDPHWSIRWCVSEFLKKFPELPELEKTHDPEFVTVQAQPVLEWWTKLQGDGHDGRPTSNL